MWLVRVCLCVVSEGVWEGGRRVPLLEAIMTRIQ